MSSPVRQKIAAHTRSRRDAYVEDTLTQTVAGPAAPGAVQLERRDVEQMIDGFLALLGEALEGESRDIRTFFLETVIPGLIASGIPAPGVVGGVARFAVIVSVDAVTALAPEERAEASAWLASFFNDYLTDMVRIAMEASK